MKSRLRKKYCGCRCAHDKSFDDDFTFLGIYDQTVTQSYNRKQKKK